MDRLQKITIHLLLLVLFLVGASFVNAQEVLTIPHPLKHDGLTFSESLTITTTQKLPLTPLNISFDTQANTLTKLLDEYEARKKETEAEPTTGPTPNLLSASSSSSITPTITPTPTITSTIKPTMPVSLSNGGLNADILFDMSNNYRTGKGLAPFQKDERICSIAAVRAPEIGAEIAEGRMHAGKNSHNTGFPFTENVITMRSESEAFNWWLNDGPWNGIHRAQIEADNKYSCVACSGFACTQEFTNF